jgi:hypothetical protein
MENPSENMPLIQMQQGESGQWHVSQVGLAEPLASFADMEAAVDYASDFAQTSGGRIVQHLD